MFFKNEMKIKVNGMSCAHCEKAVASAAMAVEGVTDAKASAKKGVLVFKAKDKNVIEQIKANVIEKGFTVE